MFRRASDNINYRRMWFDFKKQCLCGSQNILNQNRASADLALKAMDKIEIEYQMKSCSVKDLIVNKGGIQDDRPE